MDDNNVNNNASPVSVGKNPANTAASSAEAAPVALTKKGVMKGNVEMTVAKVFSGLNQNALRYLLPRWMEAMSGVVLRLGAGALLFWIYGWLNPKQKDNSSFKDRMQLLLIGMVFVFGYMWCLLKGLSYTTPIDSSIFISLQPIWVFIIALFLKTDRFSLMKAGGMALGVGGALVIVFTSKTSAVASDPLLGDALCLAGSMLYSIYLVLSKRYLRRLSDATVSKWTFLGGALPAIVMVIVSGWEAPVLHTGLFSLPFLVLLFVLIFPSFVSYLLQDMALRYISATSVAMYGDLILVISAIASYLFHQDIFSWWQILSIVMVLISVYMVEKSEIKDHLNAA